MEISVFISDHPAPPPPKDGNDKFLVFDLEWSNLARNAKTIGRIKSRVKTVTLRYCSFLIPCSTAESLNTLQPISRQLIKLKFCMMNDDSLSGKDRVQKLLYFVNQSVFNQCKIFSQIVTDFLQWKRERKSLSKSQFYSKDYISDNALNYNKREYK